MEINQLVMSDEKVAVIEDGAWVDGFAEAPGVGFFVRGFSSDAVQQALAAAQIEARLKNGGKPIGTEEMSNIASRVLAEVALLDWRGLTDQEVPVPFDRELAVKWLTSRGGKRISMLVFAAAQRIDNDTESFIDQATKN
ncbi:hypothetical protein [Pseudomonas sp.]|uniref:hypothetical protein n=1 Tax=Pseudomonas sp. TaxID=306 RepID=UPI002589159F|nr:hypothetical protein [Pseudomonas sp.]